ncbi:RDD family protein [Aquibacillus sediminis]|uniref:RDD family protein n=1 Tax=Aquibacillus sediminis TaxID=2574734 RepID=UPI0011097424|nr:RDD family protein [Aquibacillus sediminis]
MRVNNPAGFWNRVTARILDIIIISVSIALISIPLYGDLYLFTDVYNYRLIDLSGFLYGIILPIIWCGYTLGRRVVRNRIVGIDGGNVGYRTMLLRERVASIVYALTLGIGIIISAFMVGIREDKRAIHDFIAGTYVTKNACQKSPEEQFS